MRDVVAWERVPARPGRYASFPAALGARLNGVLRTRGIDQLYTHQAAAIDGVLRGEHVCVVTSTASGKTLCYNLPVLNTLLRDPQATGRRTAAPWVSSKRNGCLPPPKPAGVFPLPPG